MRPVTTNHPINQLARKLGDTILDRLQGNPQGARLLAQLPSYTEEACLHAIVTAALSRGFQPVVVAPKVLHYTYERLLPNGVTVISPQKVLVERRVGRDPLAGSTLVVATGLDGQFGPTTLAAITAADPARPVLGTYWAACDPQKLAVLSDGRHDITCFRYKLDEAMAVVVDSNSKSPAETAPVALPAVETVTLSPGQLAELLRQSRNLRGAVRSTSDLLPDRADSEPEAAPAP